MFRMNNFTVHCSANATLCGIVRLFCDTRTCLSNKIVKVIHPNVFILKYKIYFAPDSSMSLIYLY